MSSRLRTLTGRTATTGSVLLAAAPHPLPTRGADCASRRTPWRPGRQPSHRWPVTPRVRSGSDLRTPHPLPSAQQCVTPRQRSRRMGSEPVSRLAMRTSRRPRRTSFGPRVVIALPMAGEQSGDHQLMAGTRRGTERTPRPTRAESRPRDRQRLLAERLSTARNDRERVSVAAANLRAVMADPTVTDDLARQTADQAVKFLIALADQLQNATRGKK